MISKPVSFVFLILGAVFLDFDAGNFSGSERFWNSRFYPDFWPSVAFFWVFSVLTHDDWFEALKNDFMQFLGGSGFEVPFSGLEIWLQSWGLNL